MREGPRRAVTPWQALVFYKGDRVLGGGGSGRRESDCFPSR
ncbi:MAG: aminomethyltransferase beta-barrel domain-containing protein [Thermodesulfobacteriota bacterium]